MDNDIDYKALYEQMVADNEQLRERLTRFALHRQLSFEKAYRAFLALDWQARYFVVAILCAIAYTISHIVRDFRSA